LRVDLRRAWPPGPAQVGITHETLRVLGLSFRTDATIVLIGELGVTGEVQERDGRRSDLPALRQPGPLHARLGPEHGRVNHVVLEVPAVEQDQRAFQVGDQ
jgi:hypothetical protein